MNTQAPLPAHIAIIMDGNGRWAKRRHRPRTFGHQAGQKAVRRTVEHCARLGVETLTVFAFSSENWSRPKQEVSRLMELFIRALDREAVRLHENDIQIRFIGDRSAFEPALQLRMANAEALTRENTRMRFVVAANYGGRWDIMEATRRIAVAVAEGRVRPQDIDEAMLSGAMSLAGVADPDLVVRTGGEMRVSNFLLWQSAYAEMYFSDVLWPDFDEAELDRAIAAFRSRERRFGRTGPQVKAKASA
jgi:undecaprenyl diphosphate synthase